MMDERERILSELECDGTLYEPNRLRARIEALDRLDAHFPDGELAGGAVAGPETEIHLRARTIHRRL